LVSGAVPLIPIQHWFFAQELVQPEHFNQALLLESREGLDAGLLERAIGICWRITMGCGCASLALQLGGNNIIRSRQRQGRC
jgi:hypothetical protein